MCVFVFTKLPQSEVDHSTNRFQIKLFKIVKCLILFKYFQTGNSGAFSQKQTEGSSTDQTVLFVCQFPTLCDASHTSQRHFKFQQQKMYKLMVTLCTLPFIALKYLPYCNFQAVLLSSILTFRCGGGW